MLTRTARSLIVSGSSLRPSISRLSSQIRLNSTDAAEQQKKTQDTSASGETKPMSEEELKALKEKLAKCESDLAETKDKFLRAMAETENTRTRMRKEVENVKIYGIQGFCKDLLEVADVLNLAITNTDPSKDTSVAAAADELKNKLHSMHNGLVMTETCLLKIFEKHGLTRIIPKEGEKFDPNLHEAIFRLQMPDKQSGTVSVMTKIGFKLHERVIRAAQVGVVQ